MRNGEKEFYVDKSAADKLLIKAGTKVFFVNPPNDIENLLGPRPASIEVVHEEGMPADLVLAFFNSRQELEARLDMLEMNLRPGGTLWVAYHKGTSKIKTNINRDSINAYAKTLGWQGVAMISINEDWSALRLKKM